MSLSPQCSPRSSVSFTVWWERSRVCLVIVHFWTRLSAISSYLEMELPFIQFIYKLPIWKTQQWPQDWKVLVFIPIPKKGNAKEYSNYRTIALISHASKIMLNILQARLQQYMNCELPEFKLVLEMAEEPEIKLPISDGSWKKQESSRKTSISALLTTPNALTVWITINCGKF